MAYRFEVSIDEIYGLSYSNEPTLTLTTVPSGFDIEFTGGMISNYPDSSKPNDGIWKASYGGGIYDTEIVEQIEEYKYTLSANGFNPITFTSTDGALEIEEVTMTPSLDVSVLSDGTNSYAIKDAQVRSDIASLQTNKVPTTRKVNGKALSSDITLTASDVGALSSISSSDVTTALGYTPLQSSDISNMVTTDTSQTITSSKEFSANPSISNNQPNIQIKSQSITKGTTPSATKYSWFGTIFDNTGTNQEDKMAQIYHTYYYNGLTALNFEIFNPTADSTATSKIALLHDGTNTYATAPTPTEDTNNSVQIDTVGARNTKLANYALDNTVVKTSGDQNITNTKTFEQLNTKNGIVVIDSRITKGTNPANTLYKGMIYINDTNATTANAWQDTRLGVVEYYLTDTGQSCIQFCVYKNTASATASSVFRIKYDTASSTSWAELNSSPTTTDQSKKVATTEFVRNQPGIFWYGTSSSAADATEKVVTISGYNSALSPSAGQCLIVKPTTTSTVANSTIKIVDSNNNVLLAAKDMRYNNAAITTSTDSIVWNANYPTIFMYDGTYWVFLAHGIDSNTTYSAMSVAEGTAGTATNSRTMRADYLKDIITARMTTQISGYNASKTQTLKNVSGTLTWVDD